MSVLSPALSSLGWGSASDDGYRSHESVVCNMDRNEGIIRWSPNTTRDEFMHINLSHRIVQVYAATGHAKPGRFDFEKRSKHSEFSYLATYDWSPASRGLVAVGTSNGDVQILRVDDDSNASITLPLKLQRPCQTVAFNSTGLLAVGLDRVRNDACLQIWDVNQRLTDWDTTKTGFAFPASSKGSSDPVPVKKLEASVSVTSVRFYEDQPQLLIAGIKNQSLRIHDLRDPTSSVITFTTRCNNNLAIDYVDPNYVASSSLDNPGFVVWDRRATNRSVCSSSYLQAVDDDGLPFGGTLNIKTGIRVGNSCIKQLRFSREQAGALGILSTTGELRVCQTRKEFLDPGDQPQKSPLLLEIKQSYDLQYPYDDPLLPRRYEDRIVSFDWMNVGTSDLEARVIVLRANGQFEVLAMPTKTANHLWQLTAWEPPHRLGENHLTAMNFDSRAEQEANIGPLLATALKDAIPVFGIDSYKNPAKRAALNAAVKSMVHTSGDHVVDLVDPSYSTTLSALHVSSDTKDEKPSQQPKARETAIQDNEVPALQEPLSSTEQHDEEHYGNLRTKPGTKEHHEYLDKVMLRRAKNGYLFNSRLNMSLVSEDRWLQDVWKWVYSSEKAAADDGMVSGPLDLSYLGIHTIWTNSLGEQFRTRLVDGSSTNPDVTQWEQHIASINSDAGYLPYSGVETSKPHHRELCLALCGLAQPLDLFKESLPDLLKDNLYTNAAAQALFEGADDLAVDILKDGGTELVFVALALEMKLTNPKTTTTDSKKWSKALSQYSMGNDPFLKAICSYITTGSWDQIVSQTSLPLRYRIGVALRTYTDSELTTFLTQETESAIEGGSIEGILLTGITDNLVDILATYIAKFADYQTPILLISFCSPRYITDIRCDAWRKAYSAFLHRHKEFVLRIQFEQGASKKSRRRDGKPVITAPPRQITIRCLNCDSAVASDLSNTGSRSHSHSLNSRENRVPNPLMAVDKAAGLSCSKCGAHLARCAICMEHVGVPRSDRPELSTNPVIRREAKFPAFCMRCKHVMHLDHANAWFGRHVECPVSECSCQCNFVPVWDRGLGI